MYLELREPVVVGVVKVNASALFRTTEPDPEVVNIDVGTGYGIGDLQPVSGALLNLAGAHDDPAGDGHWFVDYRDGKAASELGPPKKLGGLELAHVSQSVL